VRRALLLLWLASFRNRTVARLKRLRRPRHLLGLALGGAYFLWLFGIHLGGGLRMGGAGQTAAPLAEIADLAYRIAPVGLLLAVGAVWLLPNFQLFRFRNAEVFWLLQAPLTRRQLTEALVLRDQGSVLLSALLTTLLTAWFAGLSPLGLFPVFWLFLALLYFHGAIAAAVRLRIARRWGRFPGWALPALLVLGIALTAAAGLSLSIEPPPPGGFDSIEERTAWFGDLLDAGPLPYLALPGRLFLGPVLGGSASPAALAGALLLLALHVPLLTLLSGPVFHEALLAAAAARARRERARGGRKLRRHREPPWRLRPLGRPETAFLWKGLAAMGRLGSPFGLALAAAVLLMAALLGLTVGQREVFFLPRLLLGGGFCLVGFFLALSGGNIAAMRGLQRDLGTLETLRSLPCRGRTVVLGAVAGPVAMLSAATVTCAWAGLLMLAGAGGKGIPWPWCLGLGAAALLFLPTFLLAYGLVSTVVLLLWPDWFATVEAASRGVEAVGQRMLVAVVHIFALLLIAGPALVAGLVVGVPASLVGGPAGVVLGALAAAAVFLIEAPLLVLAAGPLYDALDVSEVTS